MEGSKGQGLVEYALILLLTAVVVIVLMAIATGILNTPPCNRAGGTAGDVVDCIATRTAEARNR